MKASATTTQTIAGSAEGRLPFVDTARGMCIIMVVMMHSALGVGLAMGGTGFVHDIVAFAKPFRMPDFFLVSGLFVGRSLHLPLRQFTDRKMLHFAYFYLLWLFIVLAVKAGELHIASPAAFIGAYAQGLVEPFSTMWFIALLPFFFLFARITRKLPAIPVLLASAALHLLAASFPSDSDYAMGSAMTGSTLIDSFALYLVYFLIGHYFRQRIFALARAAAARPGLALFGLFFWAVEEGMGVRTGLTEVPGLTLSYAIFGALAVVTLAAVLADRAPFAFLALCGRNSLTIYLAFVIPMAASRILIVKSGVIDDVGVTSALVTFIAIAGALAAGALVKGTRLSFLFTRPAWARLTAPAPLPGVKSVAAE